MAGKDKLQTYYAKPYPVTAVLVTEDNIRALAKEFFCKVYMEDDQGLYLQHEIWDTIIRVGSYLVVDGKYPEAMSVEEFEEKFGTLAELGGYKHVEV